MSEVNARIVLAFYSGGEGYAEQAFRALTSTGVTAQYFRANGLSAEGSVPSGRQYAPLRLEGEELLILEVAPAAVPGVVKTLRTSGEPGVFLGCPEEGRKPRAHKPDAAQSDPKCSWRCIPERLNEYEALLKETRADLIEAIRVDQTVTESGKW